MPTVPRYREEGSGIFCRNRREFAPWEKLLNISLDKKFLRALK
jgi:hypothetical protein